MVERNWEMGILNAVVTTRTSRLARMAMASMMPTKATSAARIANGGAFCLDIYSPNGQGKNMVIAGNYFNADINGNTFGANLGAILDAVA